MVPLLSAGELLARGKLPPPPPPGSFADSQVLQMPYLIQYVGRNSFYLALHDHLHISAINQTCTRSPEVQKQAGR